MVDELLDEMPYLMRAMKAVGGLPTFTNVAFVLNEDQAASATAPVALISAATSKLVIEPTTINEAIELHKRSDKLFRKAGLGNPGMKVGNLALRAITAYMPRAVVLIQRAFCHLNLKESFNALQDTHAALVLDPTQAKAVLYQAQALYQMKEYEAAKLACKRGIKMEMKDHVFA